MVILMRLPYVAAHPLRTQALQQVLMARDTSLQEVLSDCLLEHYCDEVPEADQNVIEAKIQMEYAEHKRYYRRKRFALLQVTEKGKVRYYDSERYTTLFELAQRAAEALDGASAADVFSDCLETKPDYMTNFLTGFDVDHRVALCAEINLDKGIVRERNGAYWTEYSAQQIADALAATRDCATPEEQKRLFEARLYRDWPGFGGNSGDPATTT